VILEPKPRIISSLESAFYKIPRRIAEKHIIGKGFSTMFKGRDMIGKTIVSYDNGEKFDAVKDLIFDQDSHQLLGFLVREGGWLKHAQILLLGDVQAIGVDAVITGASQLCNE
jgi:sporulation protein YlmC with PRC-barrel domain